MYLPTMWLAQIRNARFVICDFSFFFSYLMEGINEEYLKVFKSLQNYSGDAASLFKGPHFTGNHCFGFKNRRLLANA